MTALTRWFAQPWALWLLVALPALVLVFAWARWRRRQALRQLGSMFLIERLLLVRPRVRRWQSFLMLVSLSLLIVGMAGPRWGLAGPPELLTGKDLVIVLDVSKSMLAEQPSRLERSRRALTDLADMLESRGGHRVGLVLFAAHARLRIPLTADYDHFRFTLAETDELPPYLRPQTGEKIPSGTRLGEALRLAVAAHDPARAGWQEIVLLSDGDDPAGDDEWAQGLQDARRHGIPVHVVAVGDPQAAHPIRAGGDVFRHEGAVVLSRLNEALLQEVARRTGGFYFPAHQSTLLLGKLLRGYLDTGPPPPRDEEDAPLFQLEPRHTWFLLSSLLLFCGTMLLGDGVGGHNERREPGGTRWLLAMAALILVSAASPALDDALREANTAFARQRYEEALAWYAQAEKLTIDPGFVAFNKGAALFRLGRFDEAALHYQRCLEDQLIPADRRARANYDLATALVRAAPEDRRRLEQAIAAYRHCLTDADASDLRSDAQYNLDLAKWLWLKAKPADTPETPDGPEQPNSTRPDEPRGPNEPATGTQDGKGVPEERGADKNGVEQPGLDSKQKKMAHGPLQALPDDDKLTPLPPEETIAHLEQLLERMRRERRAAWQQTPIVPHVKDW